MTSLDPRYVTVFRFVQDLKHPVPIAVTLAGMVNVTKLVQPSKTLSDSDVMAVGSVHSTRLVQPLKTLAASEDSDANVLRSTFDTPDLSNDEEPISAISVPSCLISENFVQPQNARAPIDVMVLCFVTVSKTTQPSNVLSGIDVIEL